MADVSELKSGSKESESISERNKNSEEKNTAHLGKEEKLDEDVPEDFFDDFLKEDFMAGLDIVDEDNEPEETNEVNKQVSKPKVNESPKVVKNKERKDTKKNFRGKFDHVKKPKASSSSIKFNNSKKIRKQREHDIELEKLDKELEEIRQAPLKRQETSGVDADNFDIRRDPEKTRQAIQRDKIKSAKDKEKRLITDIVETGLVPPGMELEVDIQEMRQTEKTEHITDLRQKIRPRKTRSKSCENSKSSIKKRVLPQKRSPTSPKRRRTRTPTRNSRGKIPEESNNGFDRNRSFVKETPDLQRRSLPRRSPLSRRSPHRGHLIHHSPIISRSSELVKGHSSPTRRSARDTNWSPIRRRSRSPRRNSPFWRRSRSRSPVDRRSSTNRRSRSKNNLDNYRRRRRNHSFSPMDKGRRRRTRSRTPKKNKKEEKVSFLEELVAKLNETHSSQSSIPPMAPPVNYFMPSEPQSMITPVPPVVQQRPMSANFFTPASVQAPPIQTTSQIYDPYDESFFIGNAAPLMSNSSHFGNETSNQMDPGTSQPSTQATSTQRYIPNFTSSKDVAKLFGDKRIKLSDFLAITAKPQVSNASSAKLQEKIKVIQRCQHAIKILNERKFSGPLVVEKTDSYEHSKDMTVSPLLRKPIVQLPFTTPGAKISRDMDFARCCEVLLHRVGIEKRLVSQMKHENDKVNVVPPKEVTQKDTPPLILYTKQYSETPPIKIITKSLSTQTDKELSSCKECLRRKGILYANSAVQAGSPMVTFSVSTQVNEADFYSMIPRTQSLASLTPAQLLGKQSMITNSSNYDQSRVTRNMGPQDNMPRARQVPSPPLPPVFHFSPPNESSYPPPLFSQTSLSSILQARSSIPPNKPYNKDDRWGGFNKRY